MDFFRLLCFFGVDLIIFLTGKNYTIMIKLRSPVDRELDFYTSAEEKKLN